MSPVRQLPLSEPWINLSQDFLFLPKGVRYSLRTDCTAKLHYQSEGSSESEACQRYRLFQLYGVENEKGRKIRAEGWQERCEKKEKEWLQRPCERRTCDQFQSRNVLVFRLWVFPSQRFILPPKTQNLNRLMKCHNC